MDGELKVSLIEFIRFFYIGLSVIFLYTSSHVFAGARSNTIAHFSPPAENPAFAPPPYRLETSSPPPSYTDTALTQDPIPLTQRQEARLNTDPRPTPVPAQHAIPESSDGQYTMAIHYFNGTGGFPKNYFQAVTLAQLSALKNNYRAQPFLGWLYLKGKAVQKNCRKARALLYKSARRHNPSGFFHLGSLAEEGCDEAGRSIIAPHLNQALHFYAHAAHPKNRPENQSLENKEADDRANHLALKKLKNLRSQLNPGFEHFGFDEDISRDTEHFAKTFTDPAYIARLYELGTTQEGGRVVRDLPMAIHFFAHAVDQQIPGALTQLLRLKAVLDPGFISTDYDYHQDIDCFQTVRFTPALFIRIIPEQFTTNICSMCHNELTGYAGALTLLPCGHVYHAHCHSRWTNGADGLDGRLDGHTVPHTTCATCHICLPNY